MAKFKNREGKDEMPKINTSSMPDVIFMLLFFFMTVTSMRTTELLVQIDPPEASEIAKLDRKDVTSYIYIGPPTKALQAKLGTDSRIQLNDSFKSVTDIRDFVISEREKLTEADRAFMTVSFKVDRDVRMGVVSDIKQELRRSSALKIFYSAVRPSSNN